MVVEALFKAKPQAGLVDLLDFVLYVAGKLTKVFQSLFDLQRIDQ
jgi:hypothetical protein